MKRQKETRPRRPIKKVLNYLITTLQYLPLIYQLYRLIHGLATNDFDPDNLMDLIESLFSK